MCVRCVMWLDVTDLSWFSLYRLVASVFAIEVGEDGRTVLSLTDVLLVWRRSVSCVSASLGMCVLGERPPEVQNHVFFAFSCVFWSLS